MHRLLAIARNSKVTAATVYATQNMRLTTRLTEPASWLLLHRAVKEGENDAGTV